MYFEASFISDSCCRFLACECLTRLLPWSEVSSRSVRQQLADSRRRETFSRGRSIPSRLPLRFQIFEGHSCLLKLSTFAMCRIARFGNFSCVSTSLGCDASAAYNRTLRISACHSLILVLNPMERGVHSPREYRVWSLMALVTSSVSLRVCFSETPPDTRGT